MDRSITFRPTAEDMIAVARGSFRRYLVKPRISSQFVVIFLGAWIVGIASGSSFDTRNVSIELVGWMAAWCFGCLFLLLAAIDLAMPRRTRRLFRQQRSLAHDFTVEWDEAGLTQRWCEGAFRTTWLEYHDCFENRDVIAFGVNERVYHFAPKRAMTSEQCASLREAAGSIATARRAPNSPR